MVADAGKGSARIRRRGGFAWMAVCTLVVGCGNTEDLFYSFNPFKDLREVVQAAGSSLFQNKIAAIGARQEGDVLRIRVGGAGIREVLLLLKIPEGSCPPDCSFPGLEGRAGRIAGGGPPDRFFDVRIPETGEYFVYVVYDPHLTPFERRASLEVREGDAKSDPRRTQRVVLCFAPGFLQGDDTNQLTAAERKQLEPLEGIVRRRVYELVSETFSAFAGSGMDIRFVEDCAVEADMPASPYSRITFLPDHKAAPLTGGLIAADAPRDAVPVPICLTDKDDACCKPVIFGAVLDGGVSLDVGNRRLDDNAEVYVGSFLGSSPACRTATFDSLDKVALALAGTAAHEIGHLLGLYHSPNLDVMQIAPNLSSQRVLGFAPSIILIDGDRMTDPFDRSVLPGFAAFRSVGFIGISNVIQDPAFYFRAILAPP